MQNGTALSQGLLGALRELATLGIRVALIFIGQIGAGRNTDPPLPLRLVSSPWSE